MMYYVNHQMALYELELNKVETLNCSFSSVQSLSRVRLFATPWITARQASLSITNIGPHMYR